MTAPDPTTLERTDLADECRRFAAERAIEWRSEEPTIQFPVGYTFRFAEGARPDRSVYEVVRRCAPGSRPFYPRGPGWWVDMVHATHDDFYVVRPLGSGPAAIECVPPEALKQGTAVTDDERGQRCPR